MLSTGSSAGNNVQQNCLGFSDVSDISIGANKLLMRTKLVRMSRYLEECRDELGRSCTMVAHKLFSCLVAHCQRRRVANDRLRKAVVQRP